LTSCGDNNDSDSLIGTWQLTSITASGCDLAEDNTSLVLDDNGCVSQDGIQICILQLISFNENGTLTTDISFEIPGFEDLGFTVEDLDIDISDFGDDNSTWTMISDTVVEICDDVDGCNQASYTLSGDRLTLSGFDEDDVNCMTSLVYERN
jgi:hypothetical protein